MSTLLITETGMMSENEERRRLVGRRIRQARDRLALSQTQLGELLGFERRVISRWERGEREPRARNLRRLARALEQPEAWFFTDDGEVTP